MLQEGEGGGRWGERMDGQAKRQRRKNGREGKGERGGCTLRWEASEGDK